MYLPVGRWLVVFCLLSMWGLGCVLPAGATDRPAATLLVLGSPECFNCRLMEPIVHRLREEYRGRVAMPGIDVKADREQARTFRIRKTPTLIFFDGHQREVYRHEGYMGRDEIVNVLEQVLGSGKQADR